MFSPPPATCAEAGANLGRPADHPGAVAGRSHQASVERPRDSELLQAQEGVPVVRLRQIVRCTFVAVLLKKNQTNKKTNSNVFFLCFIQFL